MTRKKSGIKRLYFTSFMSALTLTAHGDGNGDFRGAISKLDHIKSLGVDCIWVMPMYPSPLRDDGYDVAGLL